MNTTTTKKTKLEKLTAALYVQGISLFTCKSSYPEDDAPRNLMGRTHYVDPDTLKYFGARILNAGHSKDGLLYWMVESVSSRPDHGGYTRRAVVFDLMGEVLTDRDEWFKVTGKAEDYALKFVREFDAVKHTTEKLRSKMKSEIVKARETLAALK